MSVVRTLRVRVDWVQFPAARPQKKTFEIRKSFFGGPGGNRTPD